LLGTPGLAGGPGAVGLGLIHGHKGVKAPEFVPGNPALAEPGRGTLVLGVVEELYSLFVR
jgi:hypothetical protein